MKAEIDYYALGARIRAAREKKSLTQEQLGEMCSLSAAHIGHIERGTRTPSLDSVCAISAALGVSMDGLLIDSFSGEDLLVHISSLLRDKEPAKVLRFVSMVAAMAEKIDEI